MPTDRESLVSVRDGFANLKYKDEDELNRLEQRGRMYIRRVFGENSEYYQQFVRTGFHPLVYPHDAQYEREMWISGQRQTVNLLDTALEELPLNAATPESRKDDSDIARSNRVFVVHGHDNEMKQAVARTVERLSLEAVILHEKPNRGQTIIEKIERYSDVDFAVVLLSPDDTGFSNAGGPGTAQPRARQNVIFELGYFAGKLGRENVEALYRGEIELPSDYDGVLYTPYDSDSGTWRGKLVAELKESGYSVSADDL